MGQLIQPEDIADTILFLASERAKMLTGQVIKVSEDTQYSFTKHNRGIHLNASVVLLSFIC